MDPFKGPLIKISSSPVNVKDFIIFHPQDVAKLHPLSPEIISRQATINIGKMNRAIIWTKTMG